MSLWKKSIYIIYIIYILPLAFADAIVPKHSHPQGHIVCVFFPAVTAESIANKA